MKYVYVLISDGKDYYIEQTYVSIFSLRYYNPNAQIIVVTDKSTYKYLKQHCKILKYIEKIKTVDVPQSFTSKQKSRYLKTSLRLILDEDFIYLDADTIIIKDLSELNKINYPIGAVLDCHSMFKINYQYNYYINITKNKKNKIKDYYNTGILLVKDTYLTKQFFLNWHKKWLRDFNTFNYVDDQPSFNIINNQFQIVKNIDDGFNCQILVPNLALQILNKAYIIHYFANSANLKKIYFPLNDPTVLLKIKLKGLESNILEIIHNPQKFRIINENNEEKNKSLNSFRSFIYEKIYNFFSKIIPKI